MNRVMNCEKSAYVTFIEIQISERDLWKILIDIGSFSDKLSSLWL